MVCVYIYICISYIVQVYLYVYTYHFVTYNIYYILCLCIYISYQYIYMYIYMYVCVYIPSYFSCLEQSTTRAKTDKRMRCCCPIQRAYTLPHVQSGCTQATASRIMQDATVHTWTNVDETLIALDHGGWGKTKQKNWPRGAMRARPMRARPIRARPIRAQPIMAQAGP